MKVRERKGVRGPNESEEKRTWTRRGKGGCIRSSLLRTGYTIYCGALPYQVRRSVHCRCGNGLLMRVRERKREGERGYKRMDRAQCVSTRRGPIAFKAVTPWMGKLNYKNQLL